MVSRDYLHLGIEDFDHFSLSEFLPQLQTYTPVIPDAVASYYMNSSGLSCSDPRMYGNRLTGFQNIHDFYF